ncbi:hypothetical protein BC830DRAFT_1096336 [Chytriomyces sp. MP71]|nr:hypothetical protein BC830DRAFT_1096336 [Chytriomyces sp. MP71]
MNPSALLKLIFLIHPVLSQNLTSISSNYSVTGEVQPPMPSSAITNSTVLNQPIGNHSIVSNLIANNTGGVSLNPFAVRFGGATASTNATSITATTTVVFAQPSSVLWMFNKTALLTNSPNTMQPASRIMGVGWGLFTCIAIGAILLLASLLLSSHEYAGFASLCSSLCHRWRAHPPPADLSILAAPFSWLSLSSYLHVFLEFPWAAFPILHPRSTSPIIRV